MPVSKEIYQKLLQNNEEWVKERLKTDANYFSDLEKGQNPHFLWIGCALFIIARESSKNNFLINSFYFFRITL